MSDTQQSLIGIKKRTLIIAGIIFGLSLALNLVIIGSMMSYETWRKEHAAGTYDYEKIEKFILNQFPDETKPDVTEVLQRYRPDIIQTYAIYTNHKTLLAETLLQEQPDRASLERITADLRTAQNNISLVHHNFMIDLSLIAPIELRQKLANSINKRGPLTSRNHP